MRYKSFIIILSLIVLNILNASCIKDEKELKTNEWINKEIWGDTTLNPKDIYFIQIGSNCGTDECANAGEPIWKDCRKNHWKGIVIEPNPYVFGDLTENYLWNPGVKALQIAVADRNGIFDFYIPEEGNKAEVASLSEKHLEKHFVKKNIKISVLGVTLKRLWKMVTPPKVDILHIDVEGYDHKIILSTDFDKLIPKPKYILYENAHIPKDEINLVTKHLEKYGYFEKKKFRIDMLVELKEKGVSSPI
jgi:FkbM family methyltransferase